MKQNILNYINKCESWKTAIKSLHWNAANLSQHKLCDDIAQRLADFQDAVSEVEQSIDGNLQFNKLKSEPIYKIKTLKKFIGDVISDTTSFYKTLSGDNYIGMKSECETFINDYQRFNYLVDFTIKEDFKRSISKKLNENKLKISVKDFKESLNESIKKVLKEDDLNDMIDKKSHEKYYLSNNIVMEMDLEDPTITIWKNNEIMQEYNGQKALSRIGYLINLWKKEGGKFEDILEKIFK